MFENFENMGIRKFLFLTRNNHETLNDLSPFSIPFTHKKKKEIEEFKTSSHPQNSDWVLLDASDGEEIINAGCFQKEIDANQKRIKNFVEESGSEFPENPVDGQRFRKNGILYIYKDKND